MPSALKASTMARKQLPPNPPDPANDPFHVKLKRLVDRKRKGREYGDIAAAAGMNITSFSKLINGHVADPRFSSLARILKAIGATLSDFDRS